jgi:hypothetical protein
MKNQIILWLSSLVVVFLIGYVKNITDKDYPITSTFGIEGKKVSYKLDKVCYDKESYKNIIISDIQGIRARLFWRNNNQQYETDYKNIEDGLECNIPIQKPGQEIKYKLVIQHKGKTFEIFKKEFIPLMFWGHIPSPVHILHFILLFGALLMSLRSLLELFNNNRNLKKYAVITCTLFITLITIIAPLRNSYKLGAINNYVPPVTDLIEPILLLILFQWISGTILIFNKKYINSVTIFISSSTILLFFLL